MRFFDGLTQSEIATRLNISQMHVSRLLARSVSQLRYAAEDPAGAALMRLLLIVNTSASSVTARARVVIHKALSADHDVVLKETNRRGHAARLAQGAAADGMDAVVVLGGDGTLNEAANGLAGSPTALGVLPGGSTNVFARTLGMANDPIEATSQLLSALAARSVERGSAWASSIRATSCSTPALASMPPSWPGSRSWRRSSATPARRCS